MDKDCIAKTRARKRSSKLKSELYYYAMVAVPLIFIFIFCYIPMNGLIMAFQDFVPSKGVLHSKFIGLENFEYLFGMKESWRIINNTIVIALGKIFFGMLIAISFAVMLSEIHIRCVKRTIQTIVYLPHFLSWVILSAVVMNIFSPSGPVNQIIGLFGNPPVNFLGSNDYIRQIIIGTDIWKEFGFNSVVYLAAITAVDPGLYESAAIDGAGWWKCTWHITLPGMMPIIMLMGAINLSSVLNAGFDQVYNLYSPLTYEKADILDTYIFRVGLISRQYGLGAAVGIVKSVVGITLMLIMNKIARKTTGQSIF